MRRRARIFLYLLVVVTFACAQVPQANRASLPVGSATIEDVKGDVLVRSPQGADLGSRRGQVLNAETTIETHKGSLLLTLQDGSQVLVEPFSNVVLKVPDQSGGKYLQQLFGKVLAKIQKRLGVTPSFRMGTPSAVISVRGTQFEVTVNKQGKTTVEVYEGLVQVQSVGSIAAAVMLNPGFQTQVLPSSNPETPTEIQEHRHRIGGIHDSNLEHSNSPVFGGGALAPGANGLNPTGEDSPQNPANSGSGDSGDRKHEPH
jgi:hypothetical protein